ncbi:MAG: Crp/Fnr family transcriptional regulator [Spirochaetes bacterium]|nr:Crp/Fnr family transcriptional regulator [Spirochaetota bacterium]
MKLLNKINNISFLKSYKKGETIFLSGNEAHGFYYINSGEVRAYKTDSGGKEVEVGRFYAEDYFGEVILFTANTFPVSTETTKDSKIVFIKKTDVLELLKKDAEVSKFFIELLAFKCEKLRKRIETLTLKTVRQRLAQYLLARCGGHNHCVVHLEIKKSQLAKQLGTISETLSRNLKSLQNEEIIIVKKNVIHIINCIKLRQELNSTLHK